MTVSESCERNMRRADHNVLRVLPDQLRNRPEARPHARARANNDPLDAVEHIEACTRGLGIRYRQAATLVVRNRE